MNKHQLDEREEEYQRRIKARQESQIQDEPEKENPNAITPSAAELVALTNNFFEEKNKTRQMQLKTDEEYKNLIQSWITTVLFDLHADLTKCAMSGKNVFEIESELFINPGVLPNGKKCYEKHEFLNHLRSIIDPITIFKNKVGKGIKVTTGGYERVYCGYEKYPNAPEDVRFEYKFSW
jgi:hypothetical protein